MRGGGEGDRNWERLVLTCLVTGNGRLWVSKSGEQCVDATREGRSVEQTPCVDLK